MSTRASSCRCDPMVVGPCQISRPTTVRTIARPRRTAGRPAVLQAQRDDVRAGRDGEARRLVDAADENRRNREHDADRGRLWRGSRVRTGRFRHGSDRRTGTLAPNHLGFRSRNETETTDDQQHKRGGQTRRGPRKTSKSAPLAGHSRFSGSERARDRDAPTVARRREVMSLEFVTFVRRELARDVLVDQVVFGRADAIQSVAILENARARSRRPLPRWILQGRSAAAG